MLKAKTRILIVNPINDQKHIIYWKTEDILDNMRIKAEIKVINNQIEKRSFYEIIQAESAHSDLIFLGLPNIVSGKEKEFVQETNTLCQDIGTVILLKASTTFKELNIGAKNIQISQNETLPYTEEKKLSNRLFKLNFWKFPGKLNYPLN